VKDSIILLIAALLFPLIWFSCRYVCSCFENRLYKDLERTKGEIGTSYARYLHKLHKEEET
jgi:hypothetical protein